MRLSVFFLVCFLSVSLSQRTSEDDNPSDASTKQYTSTLSSTTQALLLNPFIKLSESDNKENSESCGRPSKPDSVLESELSPWMITAGSLYINRTAHKSSERSMAAILISKRHVVVSPLAFLDEIRIRLENKTWFSDKTPVDVTNCKNNIMEIPEQTVYQSRLWMFWCTHNAAGLCKDVVRPPVKSAIYFGECEPEKFGFGVVLLEMVQGFPNFPNLAPSCFAGKRSPHLEDNLEIHSFKWNEGPYRSVKPAKTIKCDSLDFASKLCLNVSMNVGFPAGGVFRKINGQQTLIGVVYHNDSNHSYAVSTEFYSDLFCSYAGICSKTIEETTLTPTVTTSTAQLVESTTTRQKLLETTSEETDIATTELEDDQHPITEQMEPREQPRAEELKRPQPEHDMKHIEEDVAPGEELTVLHSASSTLVNSGILILITFFTICV